MEKWLKGKHPIEENPLREDIFFQIIREYKKEHSLYEVLNNKIRLSICINEKAIKLLSTLIKYIYESVRHFFLKQLPSITIT
jgi:hypothetical protein